MHCIFFSYYAHLLKASCTTLVFVMGFCILFLFWTTTYNWPPAQVNKLCLDGTGGRTLTFWAWLKSFCTTIGFWPPALCTGLHSTILHIYNWPLTPTCFLHFASYCAVALFFPLALWVTQKQLCLIWNIAVAYFLGFCIGCGGDDNLWWLLPRG